MDDQLHCECDMEETQNHTHREGYTEMKEPDNQPHCDDDADMEEPVNLHSESGNNMDESIIQLTTQHSGK